MANLLPHDVQTAIFDRMIVRVVLVTSALLSLVGGMAIAALMPAYLTLHTQQSALSYEIAGLTQTESASALSASDSVSTTNKRLRTFQALFAAPQKISLAITHVVSDRPKGMVFTRISYEPGTGQSTSTTHVLSVSGILAHTGDQNIFLNSLKSESMFSDVAIPLSTLSRNDPSILTVVLSGTF